MADEDERPLLLREDALEVGGIPVEGAERVRGREHTVAVLLQALGHARPAGGVGPRAVDEHHGWLVRT